MIAGIDVTGRGAPSALPLYSSMARPPLSLPRLPMGTPSRQGQPGMSTANFLLQSYRDSYRDAWERMGMQTDLWTGR